MPAESLGYYSCRSCAQERIENNSALESSLATTSENYSCFQLRCVCPFYGPFDFLPGSLPVNVFESFGLDISNSDIEGVGIATEVPS